MQIKYSEEKIMAFGGLNFCHELFKKSGIATLIDNVLGQRVQTVGFDYSAIFGTHLSVFLGGGDVTEDANEHFRTSLKTIPKLAVCSADTILRAIKELATSSESSISEKGIHHEFNINKKLNRLLIKSLKKTKQLNTKTAYILDYDNQIIPTEKYDAKMTYKKCKGYQSGVSSIGAVIVHIEGRNGNSPAVYRQKETVERAFELLKEEAITINKFRADAASYQEEIIDLMLERSCQFYIRAKKCADMSQKIGQLPESSWQKVRLGVHQVEIAELNYHPFGGKNAYRIVVKRTAKEDGQVELFSGTSYNYWSIITNDIELTAKEIISFYDQRGNSERIFDVMNNDFGWGKLPCSFLNENTAFMLMTALYANFYRHIIHSFSEKISWLSSNFRLKKFVFRFVIVPAKWIRRGRQSFLKLYTSKDYANLFC